MSNERLSIVAIVTLGVAVFLLGLALDQKTDELKIAEAHIAKSDEQFWQLVEVTKESIKNTEVAVEAHRNILINPPETVNAD